MSETENLFECDVIQSAAWTHEVQEAVEKRYKKLVQKKNQLQIQVLQNSNSPRAFQRLESFAQILQRLQNLYTENECHLQFEEDTGESAKLCRSILSVA